ncbi:o-succinylbenzoate--CoA ligase [Aeromicrobium sp. PE09-221]|uniref:class I adenylate-forming enzyme family protein n=1 Tax=Aeromicrobium sp. PE09-221 TaxID=1898043 RepID=UPI000B3E5976|nr:class I adenylate-forming enzyme family protein [Aeromicrobium sp. PE09-221]OUZ11379.1 o-succinylbenzoate--CoA ligase [Aeromicrobium sp. PE09-221]
MSRTAQWQGAPPAPPAGSASTFSALWDRARERHSTRPFLIFQNEDDAVSSWTYGEFDRAVDAVIVRLREAGVGAGDGIHLCLRNCPAFVAIWLAAARLGAWIVPVDPTAAGREIRQQLARTGARLGVYGRSRGAVYRSGTEAFDGPLWELEESARDIDGWLTGDTVAGSKTAPGERDRLAIMFTSGTTSQPKGVVLTQRNYHCVAVTMAEAARLRPEHRWFVTLPLFHGNAQYYCFASAIAVGASVALTAGFSASRWVSDAIAVEATHASLFAAPMRMILARTPAQQRPARLEHVWFAQNLGAEHHRQFAELAGVTPRQLYGMTETVPVVTYDRSAEPVHDLIGHPVPGRIARLVRGASLEPVPTGETGMIAVAGRRGDDLFAEYLDDPEATARTLVQDDEGVDWLLTGDLAVDDGARGWRFVGRNDDVIKVAGENVSLTEVEAALAQAPGVLEAAVVAQDDPIRDRVPVAYVVPRDEASPPDLAALEVWATQHLAKAARPREWHVIAELPRTSVGKVRRFKLDTPTNGEH